ncbi:MAG: hypothetical protein ABEJ22_07265 [Haloferacaceae archaeon]
MDVTHSDNTGFENPPPVDASVGSRERVADGMRGGDRSDGVRSRVRGQTTLDFAIGVGVFLLVVVFVFSFLPAVLQPFSGGQETMVTADRVASSLAGGTLGSPEDPYTLDTSCTVAFFGGPASDEGCEFDKSDSFDERLGLSPRITLDVTLVGDTNGDGTPNTLCWDTPDDAQPQEGRIVESVNSECDVEFTAGAGSPGQQSVVTARRAVTVDDTYAMLVVRSW